MSVSIMLVGGPMDGKQIVLERECTFRVPVLNELPVDFNVDSEIKPETIAYFEYTKFNICGTNEPRFVYAVNGMLGDEILERLIANYKP